MKQKPQDRKKNGAAIPAAPVPGTFAWGAARRASLVGTKAFDDVLSPTISIQVSGYLSVLVLLGDGPEFARARERLLSQSAFSSDKEIEKPISSHQVLFRELTESGLTPNTSALVAVTGELQARLAGAGFALTSAQLADLMGVLTPAPGTARLTGSEGLFYIEPSVLPQFRARLSDEQFRLLSALNKSLEAEWRVAVNDISK